MSESSTRRFPQGGSHKRLCCGSTHSPEQPFAGQDAQALRQKLCPGDYSSPSQHYRQQVSPPLFVSQEQLGTPTAPYICARGTGRKPGSDLVALTGHNQQWPGQQSAQSYSTCAVSAYLVQKATEIANGRCLGDL